MELPVKERVIRNLLRLKNTEGCEEDFIMLERLFSCVQKLERDVNKFEGSSYYEDFVENMFWNIYCTSSGEVTKYIPNLYKYWCSHLDENVNLNKNLRRYTPRV